MFLIMHTVKSVLAKKNKKKTSANQLLPVEVLKNTILCKTTTQLHFKHCPKLYKKHKLKIKNGRPWKQLALTPITLCSVNSPHQYNHCTNVIAMETRKILLKTKIKENVGTNLGQTGEKVWGQNRVGCGQE